MKTPYADLLIDFQKALDAYALAQMKLGEASNGKFVTEDIRAACDTTRVVALQRFNKVLTDLQELREGKVTRVGKPRSKRCFFCGHLEDKDKAHLMVGDGTRKWVCDGCWDERLRD